MIHVSEAEGGRWRAETLAQRGFSVERLTGIEPAWSAWKASGTSFRLSVNVGSELRGCVFDLDRRWPWWARFYRPYVPLRTRARVSGSGSVGSPLAVAAPGCSGSAPTPGLQHLKQLQQGNWSRAIVCSPSRVSLVGSRKDSHDGPSH